MRISRGRGSVLALMTAVLAILVTFAGTGGAAADQVRPNENIPGPFKIQNWETPELCLDTNGAAVYHGRCNANDAGQKWGWHNNGYLKHLESGDCLTPALNDYSVFLSECSVDWQYWRHQNWAILNIVQNRCLRSGSEGAEVRYEPCMNQHQAWSVTYW